MIQTSPDASKPTLSRSITLVYAGRFRGTGASTPSGAQAGRSSFSLVLGSQLMSVPIRTKPSFQPGTPHPLFLMSSPFYSVLPGASRFLVVAPSRAATPPIGAIVNWRAWTQRSTP